METTLKKESYETFAPMFVGFYNTFLEYDNEEYDIDDYNETNGTELKYDDFNWDYRDYMERTSREFVSKLESELKYHLPIEFEYQSLYSPKEYNFTTDSIYVNVHVNIDDIYGIINENKELARQYFLDQYTSRDGFISFHSNNLEDWLNKEYILENSSHRIGALLDCICSFLINKDDIYYWVDNERYINFEPINN